MAVEMIKPKFDGTEMLSSFYDGPPVTPGTYRGFVKKIALAKIASGDNAGEPRINVVIEIDSGKFKGAGCLTGFNVIPANAWSLNQFLEAMTDGSEKQREGIRKVFWRKGYLAEKEADSKLGRPIIKIGTKFEPLGKPVAFVVTNQPDKDGEMVGKIDRFLVMKEDQDEEDEDLPTTQDDEDDTPEGDLGSDEDASEDTSDEIDSSDDEDDPWS